MAGGGAVVGEEERGGLLWRWMGRHGPGKWAECSIETIVDECGCWRNVEKWCWEADIRETEKEEVKRGEWRDEEQHRATAEEEV